MTKNPGQILICNLECLLMPNGEIIVAGKTVGFFDRFGKFLTATRHDDGSPVEAGEYE